MSDFTHAEWRTARKRHQCYEGAHHIEAGQRYLHASGIFDGGFYASSTCLPCTSFRDLVGEVDDSYWEGYFGGLRLWVWHEYWNEVSDRPMGLHLLRLSRLFGRNWEGLSGELDAARARMHGLNAARK
ncbi:hypothetical protein ABH924_003283 [Arthrobacter sp. GAS37]|uniref:hypothetical protein n=1 Tax=Arthrobacter sp. GAS37 TaxID=3156261 RepID=UPI003833AD11